MTKNDVLKLGDINNYMKSINMVSDIDTKRVNELFSESVILCPDKLKGIYISNYNESDGKEQFKDVWFFSDTYVIEALNFIIEEKERLEISVIKNNICAVTIESSNFDFSKKAERDSKLHIAFYTLGLFNCDHIAYGFNCDVLMHIYTDFIKNNIVSGSRSILG